MIVHLSEVELDCLAALWKAVVEEKKEALKLSEIFVKVIEYAKKRGDPLPSLSTVSGSVRSLVGDRVLKEVVINEIDPSTGQRSIEPGAKPREKSPKTGYKVIKQHGEILRTSFEALANSYPVEQKRQAVIDFVIALGLEPKGIRELERLLADMNFS